MATVVRTERLTKDFPTGFWRQRPHRALDALSLEITAGGVFGLLGPNGAGKTTTLKLLVHLLRPTSGRAELFGRPPRDIGARRRVGFLAEQPAFYDHLTAEELVAYFAGLFGLSGADRRDRARRALDLAGVGNDRRRLLRQCSKGTIQRVGLAQALVNDPELLMLDEPMSGLDPIGRHEVRQLILRLRDQGRTVIFSSHILSDVETLCSRVGILAGGRLVADGTPTELTAGQTRGWDIVVDGLRADVVDRVAPRLERVTRIAGDRYSLELAADSRPESLIAELAAAGASLVSVTPMRASLEDIFLERVGTGLRRSH